MKSIESVLVYDLMNLCLDTSSVHRYSDAFLIKPENLMEHVGHVCTIAYFIGSKVDDVDMGALLSKAVLHDIEESKISDIVAPVKHANANIAKEIENLGHLAVKQISKTFDDPDILEIWGEKLTLESRIVKIADVLSVLFKIHEEALYLGNKTISSYALNTYDFFGDAYFTEENDQLKEIILAIENINHELIEKINENL